jgi:hypothetical protein
MRLMMEKPQTKQIIRGQMKIGNLWVDSIITAAFYLEQDFF